MALFNDDSLIPKLTVVNKVYKWLQREKRGYKSSLHRRIGFGLTEAEFDWCVKMLEISGCCTIEVGDKGAVILTLKDVQQPES